MPSIRILIANKHTLVRQGLSQLCERMGGFTVVGEAEDSVQLVAMARMSRPDVILIEIVIPDLECVKAIHQIMHDIPAARIVALSMYRQEQCMLNCIRAGVRAYLYDTVDTRELIAAIEAVHRGEYLIDPTLAARVLSEYHRSMENERQAESLTEGEMAVLRLLTLGMNNQDIAQTLNQSVYTITNRLRTTYAKLHVANRTQAALYALRQGWVSLDELPG